MRSAQVVVALVPTSSTRYDVVDGVRAGQAAEPAHIAVAGQDALALALIRPAQASLRGRTPRNVSGAFAGRAAASW